MKTPRRNFLFFILSAAIFLLHLSLVPAIAKLQLRRPGPSQEDIDYIHTSCQNTLYPETCINSFQFYADAVQQDPRQLAFYAILKSLRKTKSLASYIISNVAGYEAQIQALYNAVNQIRDSFTQMEKLIEFDCGGESLGFQINKVQTWMSAALTNIDNVTCTHVFKDVEPLKSNVCDRVTTVKELTSNAVTLVNNYANMIYQLRNEL